MFGYIVTYPEALSRERQQRFKAMYCGLCRTLRKRHGFLTSSTLSYDLTFLALLLNALYALATNARPTRLVKAAFEFKLACLAGFLPELDGCVVCGKEDPDGFDVTRGAVCCLDCRDEDRGLCLPIDRSALQALRYLSVADPARLFSFSLPEASLDQLAQAAETYLIMQFQRSFSALDFYKGLFQLNEPVS